MSQLFPLHLLYFCVCKYSHLSLAFVFMSIVLPCGSACVYTIDSFLNFHGENVNTKCKHICYSCNDKFTYMSSDKRMYTENTFSLKHLNVKLSVLSL